VRISATSSANQSEDTKSVDAFCPAGKEVVGTGFLIALGHGEVTVNYVRPLTIWPVTLAVSVGAHEHDLYFDDWNLTAYAICATQPAGLQVYEAQSASDSADSKTVVVGCPPLMGMLGAGVWTLGASFAQIVLDDFAPNGGPTSAPRSVSVTQYEEDAVAGDWSFVAFAICAKLFTK
jgi:hypothetical protein